MSMGSVEGVSTVSHGWTLEYDSSTSLWSPGILSESASPAALAQLSYSKTSAASGSLTKSDQQKVNKAPLHTHSLRASIHLPALFWTSVEPRDRYRERVRTTLPYTPGPEAHWALPPVTISQHQSTHPCLHGGRREPSCVPRRERRVMAGDTRCLC